MDQRNTHFDKFTECAKNALIVAQREAQRRGQTFIEPEHLLLGILSESQNTACWLLNELGVVPEMVHAAIEAHLTTLLEARTTMEAGLADELVMVDTLLPLASSEQVAVGNVGTLVPFDTQAVIKPQLSSRVKQVITFAVAEFTNLRHPMLATGHFLLGMLRDEQGSAFFSAWGINLKVARAKMKRVNRQALLAEQQASPLSSPVEAMNGVSDSSPGAVQIDIAQQRKVLLQRGAARKTMLVYFLAFAVVAFAVIEFILQSPQIVSAGRAVASELAAAPALNWQPIAGWQPLLVMLYYLVINSLLMAIALPLSWYISLVIPRRNGFNQRTTRQWLRGQSKALLLFYLETYVLVEVSTLLMVIQPRTWWAWAALVPTLFFVVMGRFGSFRFLLQAKDITALNEGELATRFQVLRQRLGLPTCGLYQLKVSHRTKVANAFFAGWGRGRRVVLTDTMVQQFPPAEIEVIMAHELGHCASHDIWTSFVASGLIFMSIFYLINLYLNMFVVMLNTSSLIALLQPLYLLIGVFLFLGLLRLHLLYRRYKEYRADEFALCATNNIQAFKDGMTRLANTGMPRRRIRRSSSSTHPTLVKRLRHADEFARRRITPVALDQR